MAEFAKYLKSTAPSKGSPGVFYPGEIEHMKSVTRNKEGVEVEDATWKKLTDMAAEKGLTQKLGF